MEWVETTGKSIDEATDRALAHLGVHRSDAEIEVLEEPKSGLFGRIKGEARVRARVTPSVPRPKRTRRTSSREDKGRKGDSPGRAKGSKKSEVEVDSKGREGTVPTEKKKGGDRDRPPKKESKSKVSKKEEVVSEGITLEEQGVIAKQFLEGLLASMNIAASVTVRELDSETVELSVDAEPPAELGILVGPRGTTLQALQEVTRTVVQSKSEARIDRVLVDVAKYRERRVAALGRFAQQVANEVVESGEERALEPMSAPDRKAVHDALSEVSGIITRSEGEEPRRFVVISPAE